MDRSRANKDSRKNTLGCHRTKIKPHQSNPADSKGAWNFCLSRSREAKNPKMLYSPAVSLCAAIVAILIILTRTLVIPWLRLKRLRRQIPLHRFEDRPDTYEHYVRSTRELHYAGYEKYIKRGLPYRVKTSAGGERVILPLKYLVEIKSASQQDVSLPAEMEEVLSLRPGLSRS